MAIVTKTSVEPSNPKQHLLDMTAIKPFEETYKTAYSHGLEAIYALENVDIRSVRRIVEAHPAPIKKVSKKRPEGKEREPSQLELDLGLPFRGWIDPFVLDEPIEVLGLSRHAENCLKEHSKKLIKDLIKANLRDFVYLKGMGQGHIDEVQQKLNNYVEDKQLTYCRSIDFGAWIRSLVAAYEKKKVYVTMEQHGLADLFSLTPAESVEVRRLTLEKKQEWIDVIHKLLSEESVRQKASNDLLRVVEVFIKPWMRLRHGFATVSELLEFTQRISDNQERAASGIGFLSLVFFEGELPYRNYLYESEDDLFCSDPDIAEAYHCVLDKAVTYFRLSQTHYSLQELVGYIEREFAKSWSGFREGFVEKVLRLSPRFRVRKASDGLLRIRLS